MHSKICMFSFVIFREIENDEIVHIASMYKLKPEFVDRVCLTRQKPRNMFTKTSGMILTPTYVYLH